MIGERDLLAVIDLQRIFSAGPWTVPRLSEIVGPVARLRATFGSRTVFTRFVAPASPDAAWQAYYARWPFALQPPQSAAYRLVEPFRRLVDETLDATTFGKWQGGLSDRLPQGGRLFLAGVATDCCVLSTVLAAVDAGVEVSVIADACAGSSDRAQGQALRLMGGYAPLVRIVSLADVVSDVRPIAR